MKYIPLIALLFLSSLGMAQTKPSTLKPQIKPVVTFTDVELDSYLFRLDSVMAMIVRSDMIKEDRNWSADKLLEMRTRMLLKFRQQNDTTKVKKP